MVLLGTRPPRAVSAVPPVAPPVELAAVDLVAVGDVLMHQDVQRSAREAGQGLQSLWSDVEPLLRGADIAFANLETPVAPSTGQPGKPFQFNGPAGLPRALRASGFTIVSVANNHAYDQGSRGLAETLDRVRAAGLVAVGAGATRAEAEQPRMILVRGVRVAFLGFTDPMNENYNRGAGEPWVRPLNAEAAARAVAAARAQADAVVVSVHWGVEYSHDPTPRQRDVARRLAQAGADLILGHHPHVLQPVERLDTDGRPTLVAYSLGNFVSNQDRKYSSDLAPVADGDSRDGVAFRCRLVQERLPDGSLRVRVAEPRCVPLWTVNNWREYQAGQARRREIRVVPADPAGAAAAESEAWVRTLETRRERAAEILGRDFVQP